MPVFRGTVAHPVLARITQTKNKPVQLANMQQLSHFVVSGGGKNAMNRQRVMSVGLIHRRIRGGARIEQRI